MLLKKYANRDNCQAIDLVKSIKSIAIANILNQRDRGSVASWLFLIGSLMFVFDAILEISKGVTLSAVLHFSASIIFTIGSILFMPDPTQN
ncbi:hypothetical protein H6G17_12640 [Chroococcidiopsis sp. FACHB-1243]|uniref:hypothetical protein n=1 Tax=Chroococcidiopsis sp. [FACHB-1243] TaxID=2692781 RepID=UPI00177EDA15|nr:hypothetical protein [Chroococcidiopsis sp. [FACHB-1243]]MBD2306358.1 hypothetical protein [Chroococcidiopsis sp. [FACHB-1243]]